MSDVGVPGAAAPDEAEVRAYLERLRTAPVEEVLAELLSVLLSAAQVKIGRADARLLLDALAAIAAATEGRIDVGLQEQATNALAQLRLAQVEAERQLGTPPEAGASGAGDGGAAQGGPGAAQAAPPGGPSGPASGAQRSRLWVPGT